MQKTFFSNLALLVILNVLIKPIWILGIEVNVQRILGPEVYGNYFVLLNYALLFMVLIDFGLNNFNNRRVSRNPERMPEFLMSIGSLKLILGVIFVLVMQTIAHLLGFTAEQTQLLWGIGAIIFLQSFLLFIRSNISGIQWYRADILISVLDRSVSIVLCAILIFGLVDGFSLTIVHYIWVQIIALFVGIIVASGLLLRKTAGFKFEFKWKEAIQLIKDSFYYGLLVLLVMSYYKIDAVMIERFLDDGTKEAGVYAQAYKLLEASIMFAYLFSSLLLPMFSRMIKSREEVVSLVQLSSRLLLVPTAIISLVICSYSTELMNLFYDDEVTKTAEVLPLLILALIPIGATYIYGTLITAQGDLKTLNKIAAIGFIVNILGNAYMIPKYGITGAAITTLITQTMLGGIQMLVANKRFDLSIGWDIVIRSGAFIASIFLIDHLLVLTEIHWMLAASLTIILSILTAMLLKLFSVNQLFVLMKMQENKSLQD